MEDIQHPALLYLKATLFVVLALLAGSLLLASHPDPLAPLLLALTVWASCRAFYFAFYVIERYLDPTFRFRGLVDVAWYVVRRPR